MYVKDYMTQNPTCIQKETTVSKALDLMSANGFHRIPVTTPDGTLIGLLTEGLVSETSGSKNTALSIYELNYLLSRTKAEDIMIKDVKTIHPDDLLEEAASKMRANEVSVLPVVDEANKVIGIITENDIFEAFIELMGYRRAGTRFVVSIPQDHAGALRDLAAVFAKHGVSVSKMSVDNSKERGIEIMILADAKCPEIKQTLVEEGWSVYDVRVQEG